MEYILTMIFTTEGGKSTTLSINKIKQDITQSEVLTLMDLIISKNIFITDSGALVGKGSAKLTKRGITKYQVA